jgi:chromosome segregation ATPase
MPTAGKVLVALVIVAGLGFVALSGMVLDARQQRYLQLQQLEKRVAEAEKTAEELRTGTSEARDEYRTLAQRFDAQLNTFLDNKTIENFRKAVDQLSEIERSPTIDEAQWAAAQRAFREAEAELGQAQADLDNAYSAFLGQGADPGVRGLVAKGLGIELTTATIQRVQTAISAQRSVYEIQRSETAKNLTRLRDLVREQEDDRRTLEEVYNNAAKERDVRAQEVEQFKTDLASAKEALADQLTRLEKVRGELAALRDDFRTTIGRNVQLVKNVKEYEIRIDAARGVNTAIVSADGRIPIGKVEQVDKEDGTLRINLGTRAGVKPGSQLQVYRLAPAAKYLGVLEVTKAESDSSVGRMLAPYRQLTIQPGDTVSPEVSR